MLSLLRADFYKLTRGKLFYVCGIILSLFSCMYLFALNYATPEAYRQFYGYNGITSVMSCVGSELLCSIVTCIFIANEFSFGTIKNIISSGKTKMQFYFSKLIISFIIGTIYTLFNAVVSFSVGSALFGGMDSITRDDYLGLFRALGLVIIAEFAMQSLFVMITFLFRTTGASLTTSILIQTFDKMVLGILTVVINIKILNNAMSEFTLDKYWANTYVKAFTSLKIDQAVLIDGLIACLAMIVVTTAIGVFTFSKRDIK